MVQAIYLLPGGYVDGDGTVHRETELIPLSGKEEELLAKNILNGESASLVSVILSRRVQRIGAIKPVSEDLAGKLLVADRQYLLLKLRELTFGSQVQATVVCPWPDCRSKIDIDFSLEEVPIKASEDKGPLYSLTLSKKAALKSNNGELLRDVIFRLPTGNDQKMLAPLVYENEALALTRLLEHCVQKIGDIEHPEPDVIERLSPKARMEIEKHMEAVAPKVELTVETDCPECEREIKIPFELQQFFFGEMRTSIDLLYKEVHYLAYHYHWSEREIMEMPREKRRRYIDSLSQEIERMNDET